MKKQSLHTFAVGLLLAAASGTALASSNKTVVLVHGAFADGSSWNQVIDRLQRQHTEVIAVQLPLNSLKEDVAATQRAIARAHGDVVLVGHSWGGTVISEAGNAARVKSLVYVAAFAPDSGQSTADLAGSYPAPPGSAGIAKTAEGFLWLPEKSVRQDFAPDIKAAEQNRLIATQGPIRAEAFTEKVTHAAWHDKPSWYVVSKNDRMINPDLERSMAKAVDAKTTEVAASHVSMVSQPEEIARVIEQAVK
ncbi:TPA: alpha/beta hydrolase [Klebsiella quasipneumoniae subsp. quasipneumoniae]|uniref:alpha/beta fold hydrolase n=1 Tax=Klebsiella quasipneumoniae TaxID=1463165 RepID=UPI001F297D02|nr:alpha/beta hydrolase [Klebsiella quasipneumoniae]HBS1994488.1 alpha/beta hydrolase [Klebsiella quasipneumoniae subsp. quasipneumoniae]HCI6201718.1 alpha/beta hydrolase [Klebsiella quasipneumoniae subsp. quasipneumoniae]HCI6761326.1 alpha/beta hydrolase [Klebsiella quasipneumoniae subsp. quasipneumoniae]HCI6796091.1 alpha/beta hydrolase [Klebsiella quasipneumoniae subsp. quasipneumoniae]